MRLKVSPPPLRVPRSLFCHPFGRNILLTALFGIFNIFVLIGPVYAAQSESEPPRISVDLATAYLQNAVLKIENKRGEEALPVLKFLLKAQGVPEDVRYAAEQWVLSIEGPKGIRKSEIAKAPRPDLVTISPPQTDDETLKVTTTTKPVAATKVTKTLPVVKVPETAATETPISVAKMPAAKMSARDVEDTDAVVTQIELRLTDFKHAQGRYPGNYNELNKLLPPGESPLGEHDIIYYVARYGGFILTVRDRQQPENEMTVQRTGLIQ